MSAPDCSPNELLIATIAGLFGNARHVAVGASSPIPGAAALLARAQRERDHAPPLRLSILGSSQHNSFTSGGVEVFDMAAQGRIDVFFLGGGEIDGQANINLVGTGDYPLNTVRWPGSFGSAYLYYLVPRVILFREEHTRRTLVEKVQFVSAPGASAAHVHRPGGPHGLLTSRAWFTFDKVAKRFTLASVHPEHSEAEVREHTGFAYDCAPPVATTMVPDDATLALLRGRVKDELAETYPQFAQTLGS